MKFFPLIELILAVIGALSLIAFLVFMFLAIKDYYALKDQGKEPYDQQKT